MERSTTQRYKEQSAADNRRSLIRRCIIAGVLVAALVAGLVLWLRSVGSSRGVAVSSLPCRANQDVMIFGENVLYYDNASIHCVSPTGGHQWSFPVGSGAQFSASKDVLVIWNGAQFYILNKNGKPSYNDTLGGTVQFARAGKNYVAVVCDPEKPDQVRIAESSPDLLVKNLDGTQRDEEIDAFANKLMLDVGFFGENDQYMWTLSMDVFGTALNSVLHTFQVDRFNTGEADLGEHLVYKVLFANNKLFVFSTQQMYTFDYKATALQQTMVYGWQLVDYSEVPNRDPNLLFASNAQLNGSTLALQELRVISGSRDRRYTLPTECVGAGITADHLYAFSEDRVYCASLNEMQFTSYELPLPKDLYATDFYGLTTDNRAVIACGDNVYTVTLPMN